MAQGASVSLNMMYQVNTHGCYQLRAKKWVCRNWLQKQPQLDLL